MDLTAEVVKWQQPHDGGGARKHKSLLRAGWWLGTRLAIAFVALTSAPFVAPPLLIFSTIVLALSLPFTILVAAYAAASKLMGYLLSPPSNQFRFKCPEGVGEMGDYKRSDLGGGAWKLFDEMPMRADVAKKGLWVDVPEVPEGGVEEVGSVVYPEVVEGQVIRALDDMVGAGREEPVEIPVKVKAAIVYPHETFEVLQEGAVVLQPLVMSSENVWGTENHLATVAMDERRVERQEVPVVGEDLSSLEKISGEIYALRTIVGYTATQLLSPVQELKALYVFTGVEPPNSLVEGSNLEELRSRLQFLKSVVGVK